jgi:hypothetical protein
LFLFQHPLSPLDLEALERDLKPDFNCVRESVRYLGPPDATPSY